MSEELDVNMRCVQYMLFVSNFLFVMIALLLISIGTIIKAMYEDFEFFLESDYCSPSDILIFCGFVIFFVAFFGCWSAMRESTLLVNIYALFLIIILFLEITAAIYAVTMRVDLRSTITRNMNETFHLVETDIAVRSAFDFTQSQLMCCGVLRPSDWQLLPSYKLGNFPQSCCTGYDFYGNNNFSCPSGLNHKLYITPCSKQVTELVSQTSFLLTTGALCVAFIQIIGIIFARLLSNTIRKLKTERLVEAELRRQQIYSQIILGATLNGDCAEAHTTAASEA
ncbi:leukocyte surface antigen CD53 [Coccinella septempunctata]|uniref:leukocyte surface antigen CD53 n=1 Tax=Coccinella septempunctata TaxID=41139 RepID=UPI001D0773EE|nr:leukocyte surface antigen CD53 [Coccinella septempunctata]